MKRFKQYISERKQVGNLYHYTNIKKLPYILKDNKLKVGALQSIDAISFTRNKNLHKEDTLINTDVRFTIDGDKLSDKYKIGPFHDPYIDIKSGKKRDEFEERIKKKYIPNILKYIKSIEIINPNKIDISPDKFKELYDIDVYNHVNVDLFIKKLKEKYKIPVRVIK
jgi:hypothetical protein